MKIISIIIVIIIAILSEANCQVEPEWFVRGLFNGVGSSTTYNVETDESGNIYTLGVKAPEVSPEGGIFLMKHDSDGNELWRMAFSDPDLTTIIHYDFTLDDANNPVVCFYIMSTPRQIAVQKHDGTNGEILWTTTVPNCQFNGFEWRVNPKYLTTYEDDIYVGASNWTPDVSGSNSILIKYNSSGDTLWTRTNKGSNAPLYTNALCVHTDMEGNVYVAGHAYNTSIDYLLAKYDSEGNLQWEKFIDGEDYHSTDIGEFVTTDDMGNVYITGYSLTFGDLKDILTVKYDASGNLQWKRRYGTPGYRDSNAYYLQMDPENNLIVGGYSAYEDPYPGTGKDYIILKYSQSGDLIWDARWDHNNCADEHPFDFDMDDQGNVYICGTTRKHCYIYESITVAKCNTEGAYEWRNWHPSLFGIPWEISVTAEDQFVVVAGSYDTIMVQDATIIKYGPGASPGYEAQFLDIYFDSQIAPPYIDQQNHRITCYVHDTANLLQLIPHITISEHACMYPDSDIPTNFAVHVWYNITTFDEEESVWWIVYVEGGNVGCRERENEKLKVFPNPAWETITVELPSGSEYTLRITDLNGQEIKNYSTKSEDNAVSIDISRLQQGIFIIQLSNNNHYYYQKILIQKP